MSKRKSYSFISNFHFYCWNNHNNHHWSKRSNKTRRKYIGKSRKSIKKHCKENRITFSIYIELISQILILGAKGIASLAKNLWILAMALVYFLYQRYEEYRKDKKK